MFNSCQYETVERMLNYLNECSILVSMKPFNEWSILVSMKPFNEYSILVSKVCFPYEADIYIQE